MSRGSLLFLALLVGALSFFILQQKEVEDETRFHTEERLLGDLNPGLIVKVFVDHTDREEYLGFELGPQGWMLSDPLPYPVDRALLGALLKSLVQNARFVATAEEADLDGSFEPPRATLRITTRDEAGEERELELVLGALDVDGMSQYVRTRGGTYRILRTLDTMLQRSVRDFRSKQLLTLNPETIVRVGRTWKGLDKMNPDFSFIAERKRGGWQLISPERVRMDPFGMLLWLKGLSGVDIQGFAYDPPTDKDVADFEAPLERWDLDHPEMIVEWESNAGVKETLLMSGGYESGYWSVTRPAGQRVVGVGGKTADALIQHWTDFTDRTLIHAFRADVDAIRLLQGPNTVRLHRIKGDTFGLELIDSEGKTESLGLANPVLVDRVFGSLENGIIDGWERELVAADEFPPAAERWGYGLELGGIHGDDVQVAWVGRELFVDGGDLMRTYFRPGETMVGRVEASLLEVLSMPAADFRSLDLWSLDEVRLVQLDVRWGDLTRTYERKIQGTWRRKGQERSATELLDVLDMLFFLSAESYLDGPAGPLDQNVEVILTGQQGQTHSFVLGLDSAGQQVLETGEGIRAIPAKDSIHRALIALFRD